MGKKRECPFCHKVIEANVYSCPKCGKPMPDLLEYLRGYKYTGETVEDPLTCLMAMVLLFLIFMIVAWFMLTG